MNRMFQMPDEAVFSGQSNDNFELLKAWAGTTLAYAILRTGAGNLLTATFVTNLLVSAVVCGLGFVLHETTLRTPEADGLPYRGRLLRYSRTAPA